MEYGFIRCACASPELSVADCIFNAQKIIECIKEASQKGANLIVFPELCITGYTCSDLFLQKALEREAVRALEMIAKETESLNIISIVGAPLQNKHALFNCAVPIFRGKILAAVPKTYIPNYSEFYEVRHFASSLYSNENSIFLSGNEGSIPFGTDILLEDEKNPLFTLAIEICEDLWVPLPPSTKAGMAGATIIANLSASNEIIGKAEYRRILVSSQSARTISAYLYANAGKTESTTDMIFSGHSIIAENGTILSESEFFKNGIIYSDIDLEKLSQERKKTTTFAVNSAAGKSETGGFRKITVNLNSAAAQNISPESLDRKISPFPFIPSDEKSKKERCERIILLQANGLAKRLSHTKAKSAVIGLSGGLDSTLALLVTEKAFDILKKDRKEIIAVTMPCFGTTDRTYKNACRLAEETGTTLREINIKDAVRQHFKDIGHDENIHDVTYENAQARERTQILMDIANKENGLVIGTGDLSEFALGWATYNGDHMSMYAVNASIPKTLIRHLVNSFAEEASAEGRKTVSDVLNDILNTPVSPELLPPEDGKISQQTEKIVGPYELHDFFIYYALRFGFSPAKIFFLAQKAFPDYGNSEIKKWLVSFYRRFFSQQFKRSCMPDGAKVGTVSISPRGDWRMPSDASAQIWITEAENLKC